MKPNQTIQSNRPFTGRNSLKQERLPYLLSSRKSRLPAALLALGLALCGAGPIYAQTYTVTTLLKPAGTTGYGALQMNNLGQAIGSTKVAAGRSDVAGPAVVWENNGTYAFLPSFPGDAAANGGAISDTGLAVGYSPREIGIQTLPHRAVWWRQSGSGYVIGDWNDLLPAGYPLFLHEAEFISHDGQFVAFYARNNVSGRLFAAAAQLSPVGEITGMWPIDTLGDPAVPLLSSAAHDLHFNGSTVRMVGGCRTEDGAIHNFLWERDVFSGSNASVERSGPVDGVNSSGEAAGFIFIPGGFQPCFWRQDGSQEPIPSLGGLRGRANSLNDYGYVVGWTDRSGKNAAAQAPHPFRWDSATGITRDLNSLKSRTDTSGLEITDAYKINNSGQILGRGISKSKVSVAVLLKPQ